MRQFNWPLSVVCVASMVMVVSTGAGASVLDDAIAAWQFDGLEALNGDPQLTLTHNVGEFLPHQVDVPINAPNSDGFVGKDDPAGNGTNGFAAVHPIAADTGHPLDITGSLTIFGRVRYSEFTERDDVWRFGASSQQESRVYALEVSNTKARFILTGQGSEEEVFVEHDVVLQTSTWYDITGVFDASAQIMSIYVYDSQTGGQVGSPVTMSVPFKTLNNMLQGGSLNMLALEEPSNGTGINIGGEIDLAALWDRPLEDNEVAVLVGTTLNRAGFPAPSHESKDVLHDVTLQWTPGEHAVTHDVYVGDSFDDVDAATGPTMTGLDVNSFDPGRLEFGKTYYWRVDEVSSTPDSTVFKGDIWSFTVEPYSIPIPGAAIVVTASSVNDETTDPGRTIDGSGLAIDPDSGIETHSTEGADTMWMSASGDPSPWLMYEFESAHKLDKLLIWNSNQISEGTIGWGIKDVNIVVSMDGVDWTSVPDVGPITQGSGLAPIEAQAIDMGLAVAKYVKVNILSNWGGLLAQYGMAEAQFHVLPTQAREPMPESGSTDVLPDSVLAWRTGREADRHIVSISTDMDALANDTAASVSSSTDSLDLTSLDLQLGQTYYWQVDEVNDTEVPPVWSGPVWNLSTPDALIVDDFESYGNFSPNRPFQTWLDGFGYSADEFFPVAQEGNGTGATVGHEIWSVSSPHFDGSIMEDIITMVGSSQSMPFYYSNANGLASQIDRNWVTPQDWSGHGIQTLVINFRGDLDNTGGGQLYAKINGKQVFYQGDAAALISAWWTQWAIDLGSLGIDLQAVDSLAVGVQGNGAAGLIYMDTLGLYASAPAPTERVRIVNDEDPQISYSEGWAVWNGAGPEGESLHYANQEGSTAELTFYGTGVSLIHKASGDCGLVEALVDGVPVAINPIDTYSPTSEWNRYTSVATNLALGEHTLTITVTGLKNEAATNSYVQICGFELKQ